MGKKDITVIISVAFLVAGNLIGAGILGLPINTGLAGLVPAFISMVIVCGAMLFSASILGKEAIRVKSDHFNYPSLYEQYLGKFGKWIATAANLLILYGVLTAYLAGGTTTIIKLLGTPKLGWVVMPLFFVVMTGITVAGMGIVKKCNLLLMILMLGAFAYIVCIAETHVQVSHYKYTDWAFLPATFPIIVTAFHFHNIIPDICKDLEWDFKKVFYSMLVGMVIGFAMNAVWIQVGVGALPLAGPTSLTAAFDAGDPATVPLSTLINSKSFVVISAAFAVIAIMTSYVANGTGLRGFLGDLLVNQFKLPDSKLMVNVAAFLPPVLVAMIYPDIFLKAINVVGGVGIVTLFGILPGVIAIRKAKSKPHLALAIGMVCLFSVFLVCEVCQELGLLRLNPETEHWQSYQEKNNNK